MVALFCRDTHSSSCLWESGTPLRHAQTERLPNLRSVTQPVCKQARTLTVSRPQLGGDAGLALRNHLPTPSSRSLQTTVLLGVPSQRLVSWGKPMMSEDGGGAGGCAYAGPHTWLCGVLDMPFQFLKSSKIFQETCS